MAQRQGSTANESRRGGRSGAGDGCRCPLILHPSEQVTLYHIIELRSPAYHRFFATGTHSHNSDNARSFAGTDSLYTKYGLPSSDSHSPVVCILSSSRFASEKLLHRHMVPPLSTPLTPTAVLCSKPYTTTFHSKYHKLHLN